MAKMASRCRSGNSKAKEGKLGTLPIPAWRSAVIYAILVSCRRRGINPLHYLTDVLGRVPKAKTTHIHELFPSSVAPAITHDM